MAPPSLTLPHKGGGNGERRRKAPAGVQRGADGNEESGGNRRAASQNVQQNHDTPPIRSSFASIPSGPCVAATIIPPLAR